MADTQIRREAPAGTVIFLEGERGDCAYIIESGEVEITTVRGGERLRLAVRGAGEIFGEMAIVDNEPRSATVTATQDCHLLILSRDQLQTRLKSLDPVLRMVLGVVLDRFRDSMRRMRAEHLDSFQAGPRASDENAEDRIRAYKAAIERIELEQSLTQAMEKGEMRLFYQPIVNAGTGEPKGFEGLSRWRHPKRGLLPPSEFIGVAEETGQIRDLSRWVVTQACEDVKKIRASGRFDNTIYISVNVTAEDIRDESFYEHVRDCLRVHDVPCDALTLEITETMLMTSPEGCLAMLERYRELGVAVSIDDFGSGYSNLGYLARYPVETLKLDKGIVDQLGHGQKGVNVGRAMVSLGRTLGFRIVAEGVERGAQVVALRDLGCDSLQGYFFGAPQPLDHLLSETKVDCLV